MNNTKEIMILALKKIDDQMDIVASRNNYYASNYEKFTSGNAKYDALIRKHKIEYNTKYARNKEVISKVKLFMSNKYNQFDDELFRLLQITVCFMGDDYKSFAGFADYWGKKVIINIKNYMVKYDDGHDWIYEVASHELGHTWSYQLSKIAGFKYWEINRIAVNKYLFLKGLIKEEECKSSFKKLRVILKENLSDYSAKNAEEAFAEIFNLSCFVKTKGLDLWSHFSKRNDQDILIAKQVIKEINVMFKQAILKKCLTT